LDGGTPSGNAGDFAAFLTLRTGVPLESVPFVSTDAPVHVLVPAGVGDALGWIAPDFADASWRRGLTGVGYDTDDTDDAYKQLIATDVEDEMHTVNGSVYIRAPFWLRESPDELDTMTLRMQYDDGFVAYLNGFEVAWTNAPDPPAWDSLATANRADSAAVKFEDYDITRFKNALMVGTNVLAIQGLNETLNSSDMLILPALVTTGTGDPFEDCENQEDDDGDDLTDCEDPDCENASNCQRALFVRGDPDDNGQLNITDGIYILNYLFLGGEKPPAPFPECGVDSDPMVPSGQCNYLRCP
jgi:hypothetical protein